MSYIFKYKHNAISIPKINNNVNIIKYLISVQISSVFIIFALQLVCLHQGLNKIHVTHLLGVYQGSNL